MTDHPPNGILVRLQHLEERARDLENKVEKYVHDLEDKVDKLLFAVLGASLSLTVGAIVYALAQRK